MITVGLLTAVAGEPFRTTQKHGIDWLFDKKEVSFYVYLERDYLAFQTNVVVVKLYLSLLSFFISKRERELTL